jgi:Cu-Zn family superoxide dismutase
MGRKTRTAVVGGTVALAAALFVGSVATASASHASVALVDASGATAGWATIAEDGTGVLHLNVHVKGLTAGLHGIHLHAVGRCDVGTAPTFASAGGHHNPLGHDHGLESPTGAHAGDLPNLVVNAEGVGHLDAVSDLATLSAGLVSLFDADGSALVIHALPDDQVTNPTGNSGARIACGVIEAG